MERSRPDCRWKDIRTLPGKPDKNRQRMKPSGYRQPISCSGREVKTGAKRTDMTREERNARRWQTHIMIWEWRRDQLPKILNKMNKEQS